MSVSSIAAGWWIWIAGTAVQLCLLVPLAFILDRLLARKAWPGLQSALWFAVMVRLIWPPSISTGMPIPVVVGESPLDSVLRAEPSIAVTTMLFGVWLSGAVVCAVMVAWRHRRLRVQCLKGLDAADRLTARARRAALRLGLRRLPRVATSARAVRPAVVGVFRPVVVLPASLADEISKTELDHVLLHELGHIKRRDPLVALVCLGLQILYWFHPLVWMVRVRLATLREIACDADVVAIASRDEYRRTLLRLARPLAVDMGGLGFFARRSELITRLMILERPVPPALSPWLRRCATALLFAAVFGGAVAVDSAAAKRPAPLDPEGLTLQGCLQLRYAVYAMMAEERRNQEPQR